MRSRAARLAALALIVLVAWVGLLAWRQESAHAALVVTWSPTTLPPARDAIRGRWTWATPAQVDAWHARVASDRGWRATERMAARPTTFTQRRIRVRGHTVLLAEVPADADLSRLRAALDAEGRADLVVVAGCVDPSALTATWQGEPPAHALLPACWAPGVPATASVDASGTLVAPRVDGRTRVGRLEVRWDGDVARLSADAVELAPTDAPADAPTHLGNGDAALFHDTLRLRREGLSVALASRMRARAGTDLAILNTLALRGGLDGPVDPARLAAAIPFRNQVVRLEMTGEQLARALAQGADETTRHLVAVDANGVVTTVDPATPRSVATVDYLANGGRGNWTVFQEGTARVDTGLTLEDLALELLLGGVK